MSAPPRSRMHALGDESWRLYIDLDRQHRGSAAYDEGLGGVREPGYLASMLAAHDWAGERCESTLELRDYARLHEFVTAHEPSPDLWRPGRSWVHVPRVALERGLEAEWSALGVELAEAAPAGRGYVRVLLQKHSGRPDLVEAEVARRLHAGQVDIARATGARKIASVAALHQQLELLHPTRDANTRRHLVLLQWLLAAAGLPPCFLTEPNHVYVRTPESWARCVREGIERTRAVAHALQRGLDVPTMLTEFDIERRPLGSALGRWHRPEQGRTVWLSPTGPSGS